LLVIPLKTGFESDWCRLVNDDRAIAFVTSAGRKILPSFEAWFGF
jgi:hypothetical protein